MEITPEVAQDIADREILAAWCEDNGAADSARIMRETNRWLASAHARRLYGATAQNGG